MHELNCITAAEGQRSPDGRRAQEVRELLGLVAWTSMGPVITAHVKHILASGSLPCCSALSFVYEVATHASQSAARRGLVISTINYIIIYIVARVAIVATSRSPWNDAVEVGAVRPLAPPAIARGHAWVRPY